MAVDGETDVADFTLTSFGNALPLHARFHARVDGTDGDTWLEPVDATLGSSHFTTRGKVVRVVPPGEVTPQILANGAEGALGPGKPVAGKPVTAEELRSIRVGQLIDLRVVI